MGVLCRLFPSKKLDASRTKTDETRRSDTFKSVRDNRTRFERRVPTKERFSFLSNRSFDSRASGSEHVPVDVVAEVVYSFEREYS